MLFNYVKENPSLNRQKKKILKKNYLNIYIHNKKKFFIENIFN
jgi:hypothetical protein